MKPAQNDAARDERLQAVLSAANAAAFEWHVRSGRLTWAGEAAALLGAPPATAEELIARTHPEDRADLKASLTDCRDSGRPSSVEVRFTPPPGKSAWLLVRARRLSSGAVHAVCLDVGDRKRLELAFAIPRDRLDLVLRDSELGVSYADFAGPTTVVWNQKCREQHGVPADAEVTGDTFFARVHPEDRARVRAAIDRSVAERAPCDMTYRTVDAVTGEVRWIRSISRPSFDASGRWTRLDGVTLDVSVVERRVRARTAALEDAIAQMEMFSSTVAHDLRAPLRHMHGYGELLVSEFGEALGKTGLGYVARITNAARRMDALTRDILIYSRFARGELPVERVSLDALVDETLTGSPAFAPEAADLRIDGPLGYVIANPAALALCLSNLLGNAVKFVAPGARPRVRVRAERKGERRRLWVEDSGIGIDPAYHRKIFKPFERAAGGAYDGTGIGLAIVARAVERMDGRLGVESEAGTGARFWLELPSA